MSGLRFCPPSLFEWRVSHKQQIVHIAAFTSIARYAQSVCVSNSLEQGRYVLSPARCSTRYDHSSCYGNWLTHCLAFNLCDLLGVGVDEVCKLIHKSSPLCTSICAPWSSLESLAGSRCGGIDLGRTGEIDLSNQGVIGRIVYCILV
jgi:hypothetical protein